MVTLSGRSLAPYAALDATKNKSMKATNLGIWYVQVPNGFVINPMGEIVDPKMHNGSRFVFIERKRVAISKLPHLNYNEAMDFKHIFYK